MQTKLTEAINKLTDFKNKIDVSNSIEYKKGSNYLEWISQKTDMIINENNLVIPLSFLPKIINTYTFYKVPINIQDIIKSYYFTLANGDYRLDNRKKIDNAAAIDLAKSIQLKRGKVVWCEFGYNIGEEFGGRHPALIIKQTSNGIIAVPLSHGKAPYKKPYIVEVPKVWDFEKMDRWTSVHRIRFLSLLRVDFTDRVGSVSGEVLDNIKNALTASNLA